MVKQRASGGLPEWSRRRVLPLLRRDSITGKWVDLGLFCYEKRRQCEGRGTREVREGGEEGCSVFMLCFVFTFVE